MQGDHQTQPFIIAAVRIDEVLGTDVPATCGPSVLCGSRVLVGIVDHGVKWLPPARHAEVHGGVSGAVAAGTHCWQGLRTLSPLVRSKQSFTAGLRRSRTGPVAIVRWAPSDASADDASPPAAAAPPRKKPPPLRETRADEVRAARLLLEPVAVSSAERRAACANKLAQARGCEEARRAIREEDYLSPRRSRSPAR